MAILSIEPLAPVEPYPKWQYRNVELAGVEYDYRLRWNDREEAWYLYLQRSDGSTPPINGVKMVMGWALAERYTGRGPIGGLLILVDQGAGDGADRPTYEDLGHRWILRWIDDADIPDQSTTPSYTITVD